MRLAEILGALSLSTDLADGFSLEKCLRTCVLATRLARQHGCADSDVRLSFWSALLRFTGCTGFAHEEATHYAAGDDISLRRALAMVDFGRPHTFLARALRIAPAAGLRERAAAIGRLLTSPGAPLAHAHAQCEAGMSFARAVGMPDVADILRFRDERYDGKGSRALARGDELPLAARVADVADVAELYGWHGGLSGALDELGKRRGGALDPALVDSFVREAPALFAGLGEVSAWELFLAEEPEPWRVASSGDDVDAALGGFASLVDLASVYTLAHSQRVSALASAAARAAGLPDDDVRLTQRAGLVHDLGRVAVPVGVWEKPAALSPFERERVRQHSAHTETILRLSPSLASVADVAGATHERGAGQGYHRRLRLPELPLAARLVAAADVFVALDSDRPHRPRLGRDAALRELQAMAQSGALDAAALRAVLEVQGAARRASQLAPGGLTGRELEIVRLVAVGRTNPEIGKLLGISPRTAQRHVMNVYDKLGLESRAGLALFAVEHGLVD